MAIKKYLDLEGLKSFKEGVVAAIASGDAEALKAAKEYVGKIPEGVTDENGEAYADVLAYVKALIEDAAGDAAEVAEDLGDISTLTTTAKDDAVSAINELDAAVKVLNGEDTEAGSVKKALKDAKEYTDTSIGELGNKTEADGDAEAVPFANVKDYVDTKVANAGEAGVVTLTKQASAEDGYAATYVIAQGGTDLETKINIPKDFLLKDATLEVATAENAAEVGVDAGQKYIDFVVNVDAEDETEKHVYLGVNDLVDVYTSGSEATDAIVVAVDASTNKITATITDATISRDKIDADFEADIAALEDGLGDVDAIAVVKTPASDDGTTPAVMYDNAVDAINALNAAMGDGGSVQKQIEDAIAELDYEYDTTAEGAVATDGLVTEVKQVDGKIVVTKEQWTRITETEIQKLFNPDPETP